MATMLCCGLAMNLELNDLASQLVEEITDVPEDLRVGMVDVRGSGLLLDFGVETEGGLEAGCALASICMSGLADVAVALAGSAAGLPQPQAVKPIASKPPMASFAGNIVCLLLNRDDGKFDVEPWSAQRTLL